MSTMPTAVLDVADVVRRRYSGAAATPDGDLCCPTSYAPQYLRAIPDEVLERDSGCAGTGERG